MRVSTADGDATKLHTQIADHIKAHGEIIKEGEIGKRKLAYEIEKESHANYWLIEFNAETDSIKELHRILTLNEHVLRFLIAQTRPKTKEDIEREERMKESMEKSRMRKAQEEKDKERVAVEDKKKKELPAKKEEIKEKLSLEELDQKLDELLKDDSLND
jgi:small subunit ribosomal protein S6